MKANNPSPVCRLSTLAIVLIVLVYSRQTFSQTADSLLNTSGGALQFQLIGNLGLFYLAPCGSNAFLRIGADGSFGHSSNSTDLAQSTSSVSSGGPPSSSQWTNKPEGKSTSYTISLSAAYALNIAKYANSSLYLGVGPMTGYSYNHSSSTGSTTYGGSSSSYSNDYNRTEKTWSLGPFALLGVRAQLVSHVSLTAETSVSALYQWSSITSASHSGYTYPPQGFSMNDDYSNGTTAGWDVALKSIVIGVVVVL